MCSPKRRKRIKNSCCSEARGQSIPKHFFQNTSASAAASHSGHTSFPMSRGREAWGIISRGLFPEVKSLSMSSRKVAKRWERTRIR